MTKSYVTLEICPICKKDTGTILLDRRLKDTFESKTINPTNVCDDCRKKYLSKGVMIINPETCRLTVIKDSAFKKIMDCPIPAKKIAFAHDDVLDRLIIK
jgi:hypothetical protein